MLSGLESSSPNAAFPPGYGYNPDVVTHDYDEQAASAWKDHAHQQAPLPTFEGVPTVDISPAFNPTDAPLEEVYARNRVPDSLRVLNHATHAELTGSDEPVEMWRIAERGRVMDGSALVCSRILQSNSLGDVEDFDAVAHLASNHERRMADEAASTPLISFSTDPINLAKSVILSRGFGVREGRDPVVVRVRVSPDRVITAGRQKEPEVLLLGGVAPDEYVAAYAVSDFVSNVLPPEESVDIFGRGTLARDEALGHWAGHAQ